MKDINSGNITGFGPSCNNLTVRLYLAAICMLLFAGNISCTVNHIRNGDTDDQENCGRYTIKVLRHLKPQAVKYDVSISGIVKYCYDGKIANRADISFYNETDSLIMKVRADSLGKFELSLKPGYYSVSVFDPSGMLFVPSNYYGSRSFETELNLFLQRPAPFVQEITDPGVMKAVDSLERVLRKGGKMK